LLGISQRTARRWIADDTLPSIKIGGARLVSEADLTSMLTPEAGPESDEFAHDQTEETSAAYQSVVKAQSK